MIIAVTRPNLTKQPYNPYMNPYGQPMQPPYPPNQQYGMGSQPMQPPYPPNAPYGMSNQPMPDQMQGVRCQTCGMMNPPNSATCSQCGEKLY